MDSVETAVSGASTSAPDGAGHGPSDGHGGAQHGSFWALTVGSIGVVFGDIGTSPL